MVPVFSNVFIGGQDDCQTGAGRYAVVHAAKHPCHQRVLQYKGSLPPSHPNYLFLRRDQDLFLNIIDPDVPLFKLETFKIFLEFAMEQEGVHNRGLLIHCNSAQSRAPSLAMIYWKHIEGLEGRDYDFVKQGFLQIYPDFDPGAGIEAFMIAHWELL